MNEMHIYAYICMFSAHKERYITVGELAKQYHGIPKSTLHRYLASLVKYGWIARLKRGQYYPQQNDVTEAIIKIVAMS
jgi:DNA-binding IclR family transcriptional regulator